MILKSSNPLSFPTCETRPVVRPGSPNAATGKPFRACQRHSCHSAVVLRLVGIIFRGAQAPIPALALPGLDLTMATSRPVQFVPLS